MLYTDKRKIETAEKLKFLRENGIDERGNVRSHETLAKQINAKYEGETESTTKNEITGRTLKNYEIVDSSEENFLNGKGMTIEILIMLSDFFGVSCDYLLGTKFGRKPKSVNELGFDIGLDVQSIAILKGLKSKVQNDLLFIINSLLHSIDTTDWSNFDELNQFNDKALFQESFLDELEKYLYFTYENPKRLGFSEEEVSSSTNSLEKMGWFNLNEDQASNIFLVHIQNMLSKTRDNFKIKRNEKQKRYNSFYENMKGNSK